MNFKNIQKEEYHVNNNFRENFESWQKNMLKSIEYICIFVFIVEILFFLICIDTDFIKDTPPEYFLHYVLKPTLINTLFMIVGNIAYRYKGISDENKIAIPTLMMVFVISNIIIIHNVFAPLYSAFIIPILMSTIYANFKIEKRTFLFCLWTMFYSFIYIYIFKHPEIINYFIENCIVSFSVLILSHLLAIKIIKNEHLKEVILKESNDLNANLKEELLHDGLTGLYNHTALFNILDLYINEKIDKSLFHIAVIDIDYFKKVNDEYGHEIGNIVLKKLAKKLLELQNDKIFPARYGGEEFAIVFYDITIEEVYKIIDDLRIEFSKIYFKETNGNKITLSAGIYSYRGNMKSGDFFKKADEALYKAKNTGRNKVIKF